MNKIREWENDIHCANLWTVCRPGGVAFVFAVATQQNNMQAANLFYVAPQLNKIMCKTSVDNCASILMQFPATQQNNMQAANLFYVAPQLNKIMCKTSVDNCASILMQFPVSNIAS